MTSDILENENWRVKLYQLHNDGSWLDLGTGNAGVEFTGLPDVRSLHHEVAAIVVTKEDNDNEVLIQSKIINDDIYERQGDSIIMWREPQNGDDSSDIDYALSFQDTAGCISIWEGIENARKQLSTISATPTPPLFATDTHLGQDLSPISSGYSSSLPPVSASHLAELKLRLLSTLSFQKEVVVNQLLDQDEDYLKRLFTLFSELETDDDTDHLKIMSEVFRHIVLLNDADLLDALIQDDMFINLAAVMEYDPSLRQRADHRTFLTSKCHVKVLLPSQDPKIAQLATTLYRLKFLRDYLIRPMIDESGVTALNSMIAFTVAETCNKVFESVDMLKQILSMLSDYPRPAGGTAPAVTSLPNNNSSSPDNVIMKASLLDPSISPVAATATSVESVAEVVGSLQSIDTEATPPCGNGKSFLVNQNNDSASNENNQASFSKKRKFSDDSISEDSEVNFYFTKSEVEDHEMESQISCSSWDYEDHNNNKDNDNDNNNCSNVRESTEGVDEECFTRESDNGRDNMSSSSKIRNNRKRRSSDKSKGCIGSAAIPGSQPSYNPRQCSGESSDQMMTSFEDNELTVGTDSHSVPVSDSPTVAPSRSDILGFLRELFFLSRSLPVDRRGDLYCKLMQNTGVRSLFFKSLQSVLCDRSSTKLERVYASECLACVTLVCPVFLRAEIMEGSLPSAPPFTQEIAFFKRNLISKSCTASPSSHEGNGDVRCSDGNDGLPSDCDCARNNHLCILWVIINRVVYDAEAAVIEQLGDVLKVILDPERIDLDEKEIFLSRFYDHYMCWVLEPFALETPPDQPIPSVAADNEYSGQGQSALFTSRRFLCEVLALCIQGHQFRMRYFFMRTDLLAKILRLLDSPHRHLHIYALRVLRYTLATKDECYFRYIAKYDILRSVLYNLYSSIDKDNLLTSVIIEIADYIRSENLRTLIDYIVETHADLLRGLRHLETFQKIQARKVIATATIIIDKHISISQIKYEQTHSNFDGGGSKGGQLPDSVESQHRRERVEREDDDYLFYEEDEEEYEHRGSAGNVRPRGDRDVRKVQKDLDSSKIISQGNPIALIGSMYQGPFEDDDEEEEAEAEASETGTGTGRRGQLGVPEGQEGSLTSPRRIPSLGRKAIWRGTSSGDTGSDDVDTDLEPFEELEHDPLTWPYSGSAVDPPSANLVSSSSELEDRSASNRAIISKSNTSTNSYNKSPTISCSIFDDYNEDEVQPPLPPLKPKFDSSDDDSEGSFVRRPKAKKEKTKIPGGYFSLGLAKKRNIDDSDSKKVNFNIKSENKSTTEHVADNSDFQIDSPLNDWNPEAVEAELRGRDDSGALDAADAAVHGLAESSLGFPVANKSIS